MKCLKCIFTLKYSPEKRIFGLDLLRAVAILLVLLSHSLAYLPVTVQKNLRYFLVDGVAIFFVLSGYLIGAIMLKEFNSGITLRKITNFWKRRWLRTLPNYYFVLSVLVLLHALVLSNFSWLDCLPYYFFSQNIGIPIGDFFPESWSLAVEEWFYLTVPIIFVLFHSIFKKLDIKYYSLAAIIIFVFAGIFYRAFMYFNLHEKNYYQYDRFFLRNVLSRMDSIMYGVLGSWINRYYPHFFKIKVKSLLLIGCLIVLATHNFEGHNDIFLYVFSFSLTCIGVVLMLPFFSNWKFFSGKLRHIVTVFSLISYSMYLINLSVVNEFFVKTMDFGNEIKYLLFWIYTVTFSILLYKYIEQPFMRYRDKITTA